MSTLKACCLIQHSRGIFEATIPAEDIHFIVYDVAFVETKLLVIIDLRYRTRHGILADYLRIKIKYANH